MSKLNAINKDNFDESVSKGYTLVDMWADWCTPCKMVEPIVEEIAEEMKDKLKVVSLDVDANIEVSQKYQVQSIPTLLLFKDGELVDRMIGAMPKNVMVEFLNKNLG